MLPDTCCCLACLVATRAAGGGVHVSPVTDAAVGMQAHQSLLHTSSSAGRMSAMQLQALLAAQAAGNGRNQPEAAMHRSRSASAMSQLNPDLLLGGSGPLGQVDLTSPLPHIIIISHLCPHYHPSQFLPLELGRC